MSPGITAVLVYPFESSEPYTGGYGPGMVELLAECRRYGIVCRNLHPDNLRVVDGRLRLIDYGSDLIPLESECEYTMMCRRAWLSCRWTGRADLKAIMRSVLNGVEPPELDGFERFHEAVRRFDGPAMGRRRTMSCIEMVGEGRTGARLWLRQGAARRGDGAQGEWRSSATTPIRLHRTRWRVCGAGRRCTSCGSPMIGARSRRRDRSTSWSASRVLCTVESDEEMFAGY